MQDHGSRYLLSSDWQAQKWHQLLSLIRDTHRSLPIERAVDLGCGTGTRTSQLPLIFPTLKNITAVDSDASMLASADRYNRHPCITYRHTAMEQIGEIDLGPLDFVLSHYSLHWCPAKERLFEVLGKVTQPGAVLAVGTCDELPDIFKVIETHILNNIGHGQVSPFHYLTLEGWQDLLASYGWRIAQYLRVREPHPISSGEEFLKSWCAASAGKAFYGRSYDSIERRSIEAILTELNARYQTSNPNIWEFHENTLLFVAVRE